MEGATDTMEYTGNRCRPRSLVMGADLKAMVQYLTEPTGTLEELPIQHSP